MNFLKKLFADKKAVRSAISGLLLLVSITVMLVAVLPKTKAWFAKNNQTTANGITLTAKNQYMRFDDAFTSKAIMNGVTVAEGNYKRHTDGKTSDNKHFKFLHNFHSVNIEVLGFLVTL